jgi:hypothetical protein
LIAALARPFRDNYNGEDAPSSVKGLHMTRLLLAIALVVLCADQSLAQCQRWGPIYSPPTYVPGYAVSPWQFWGTPAPKPLPPALAPFVPKKGAGIREDEPAPPKPADKTKPKENESKEKEAPRIPKVKLLPDDPEEPAVPAKKPAPKKEPRADSINTFDQYLVPSEGNKAERPAEVKVGFFNHSDREIVLEVNGETLRLPSEQYVTLRLQRTFSWAEKGQKAADVAVPPDADGLEIVFRK